MSNSSAPTSPNASADTAKPVAPGPANPVKAPQQNQDNKQAEKPSEQQK